MYIKSEIGDETVFDEIVWPIALKFGICTFQM